MDSLTYDLFTQLDALVVQIEASGLLAPPNVTAVLERARAQFEEDCWKQLICAAIYLQREGEIAYMAYHNCMQEDPVLVVREPRRGAVLFTLTDHDGPLYRRWIENSDAFQWLTIRLLETAPKSVAQGTNSPWKT